jgi:hypothetical protein
MSSLSSNRVNFIYELGGEAGEIDVFELAPTLLSIGQLIQDSNRILNPNGQEIAVNVKPFKEGSFIVDIALFPTSHLQQLLDLVRHTSLDQIVELLKAIGVIGGLGVSAVAAIKKLKGKPKQVEELKPGEYRYASDDSSITVGKDVHTLLQHPVITQNIYNVFGKPLEKESVTKIKSYLKGEEEQTEIVIAKDEVPALKEFATNPGLPALLIAAAPELTDEHESVAYLNPKRGAYDGDGVSWSFHRGSEIITATIKDTDFLMKVERGDIRPNHKDLLKVLLLEKQRVVGTEVKAPSYEVIKVLDYQLAPSQQSLLPPATDDQPPNSELDS